jgi:hypothetical protein
VQPDQQLISQLEDAVEGARRTLEEAKQRHKARIAALRAEQRGEIHQIQAQVRGYEKALKAVANGPSNFGLSDEREALLTGSPAPGRR